MEKIPKWHKTRNCSRPLWGHRLEEGDVLEEGDFHESTGGDWQRCPCPGLTLQEGNEAVWVRPVSQVGIRILTSDDGVVACVVDELFDPVFEAEFSFDDEVVLSFKEAFFPRLRRTGRF